MIRKMRLALGARSLRVRRFCPGFPIRSVTIVVPFAAGGPILDTVARQSRRPGPTLGHTIIVENTGGAGGTIGVEKVAHAKPDGYTLLLMHIGIATSASLYRNLRYDPQKDLDPIGLIIDVPMTMIAKPAFAPKDVKELIAYVKANKDKVTYAHAGVGSASHLCGLLTSAIHRR